jgi:hypothetical protein
MDILAWRIGATLESNIERRASAEARAEGLALID